jgi:ADP-ribosylglycohydrolase
LPGIGASTLKAIRELQVGGHWNQVGRSGEFAAGNGAAMRIAPFAFFPDVSREEIRNICRITHRNDEAYVGALAVILAVRAALNKEWTGNENLLDLLIPQLPDTRVRDRFIEIRELYDQATIASIAAMGTDGYVVNAVPFAVFAASQVMNMGLKEMFKAVIDAGGDTDTNASMAGQIAGTLVGLKGIPVALMQQITQVPGFSRLKEIVDRTAAVIN